MFKKFISLLLVFSIIFLFTACGGLLEEPTTEPVTETTTQVPTVTVTIPEGYTLVRISWLLEEKGLCSSEEFVEACQNYTQWLDWTQYPFLEDLQSAENVCVELEGYFFPLTYEIPETSSVQDIIKMFLNGTKQKFDETFMMMVQESGYNLHEILTLASIIEKEAKLDEQRYMISSVIHNRLQAGMRIQCDPTIKYCDGVIKYLYPEEYEYYSTYYDTYQCPKLMAGPICSPGMASIDAALDPADTEYLYFIVGTVEPYEAKYSETFAEHNAFWQANKDRLTGN
ncbi:MAG: endolytic transglycosylase MltG [Clostridia bacterium]|nr:endolytic transglycosylase MltG [Clostridia bacterium]